MSDYVDTPEEWPVSETSVVYEGPIAKMRRDVVRMPDGSLARRDYVEHPGAVGALSLDADHRVLVLKQYRHPVRHKLWELPAGLLDVPGENPLHAAQRELYEETHHKADDWHVLVDMFTSSGGIDEAVRVFLARGVSESTGERFEAEGEELDLQLAWVPLADLVRLALEGELHNAMLVAGVLAVNAALHGDGLDALRPGDAPWPARPF